MSPQDARELLESAIPGKEIRKGNRFRELAQILPQAWKFWREDEREWAAFVVGDALSGADSTGVMKAKQIGLIPVIVAPTYRAVKTAAQYYRQLDAFVVCEVAGQGCLIPPPDSPYRLQNPPRMSRTRVPPELLDAAAEAGNLPISVRDAVAHLRDAYRKLSRRTGNHDTRESDLLLDYAKLMLDGMGLDANKINVAEMVRTLEAGRLGAGRDHFFHSFHNYFLGLVAIAKFESAFTAYQERGSLHWRVDPFNVWFLTALWHNVGYPYQRVSSIISMVLGVDPDDDEDHHVHDRFVSLPTTQEGLRVISSLLAHLLYPADPPTDWMQPGPKANLGVHAERVREALIKNLSESHGAFGGLRLYCDYQGDLDKMDRGPQTILRQTVLLASCSMPFHDFRFRSSLREICGGCRLPTTVFPFATLLAFVDSLQEDQRDVIGLKSEFRVLRCLLLEPPATVSAAMERDALVDPFLLTKIVEARDVLASFDQKRHELYFRYPRWIANEQ